MGKTRKQLKKVDDFINGILKDTSCEIDMDQVIGTIYFDSSDYDLVATTSFCMEHFKEHIASALQEAEDTVAFYESVAMRLRALMLLEIENEEELK